MRRNRTLAHMLGALPGDIAASAAASFSGLPFLTLLSVTSLNLHQTQPHKLHFHPLFPLLYSIIHLHSFIPSFISTSLFNPLFLLLHSILCFHF